MEKSLKKMINKGISLDMFDFSGFSSSNIWIGYFECEKEHSLTYIREALKLSYEFFKKELDSFIMISALKFSDEYDLREESKYYKKLFNRAKKYNIIQRATDMFDSYSYGDIPLPASCLTISFNKRNFLCLSTLLMGGDAVLGEVCFFISPKLNIAIYPHKDLGFGVISLSNNKKLGVEFLTYCSKNKNFKVHIES